MPTYEYVCKKCDHEFEAFQRMSDERLSDCPVESCEGNVRRKIGRGAGLIFKGSGFYETDYRSDSYKQGAKKDSDAGSAKPKTEGSSASGDNGSKKSSGGESKSSSSSGSSSASGSATSS